MSSEQMHLLLYLIERCCYSYPQTLERTRSSLPLKSHTAPSQQFRIPTFRTRVWHRMYSWYEVEVAVGRERVGPMAGGEEMQGRKEE